MGHYQRAHACYHTFFAFLAPALLATVVACIPSGLTADIPLRPPHACDILPDLYESSIAELQDGLENGYFSSVDLVKVSNLLVHLQLL